MDLPYFAPLCGQGLRCPGKGALGATSPNASSPRRAPPSFPFGGIHTCYFSLRSKACGHILFAFVVRFAILLRFLARSPMPSAMGKGGIPNSSPSVPRLLLGAVVAAPSKRNHPCERLGFLQFEKNPEGFFVR